MKETFNQEPYFKRSKNNIRSLSIKKGDIIGCHLTIRGKSAYKVITFLLRSDLSIISKDNHENNDCMFIRIRDAPKLFLKNSKISNIISLDLMISIKLPGNRIYVRKRYMRKKSIQSKNGEKYMKRIMLYNICGKKDIYAE